MRIGRDGASHGARQHHGWSVTAKPPMLATADARNAQDGSVVAGHEVEHFMKANRQPRLRTPSPE